MVIYVVFFKFINRLIGNWWLEKCKCLNLDFEDSEENANLEINFLLKIYM